jgi:hypothetical protein
MKRDKIEEVLERYGLDRILHDNQMSVTEVLDILDELGFIYLDMYLDDTDVDY